MVDASAHKLAHKNGPQWMMRAALVVSHVWMAPSLQVFCCVRLGRLRSCVRPVDAVAHRPLALMGSADRGLISLSGSKSLETLQVFLDPSVDRLCHHASLPSQASSYAAARQVMPPLPRTGKIPVCT